MPANLNDLIHAIPIAQDGYVITREYHNTLRTAVLALADLLNQDSAVGGRVTLSFPPSFIEDDGGPNWAYTNGIASPPADGVAKGWIPLQLPDGVRLQKMTVKGRRGGAITTFLVKLVRVSHAEAEPLNLITMQLRTTAGTPVAPFAESKEVSVTNAGPAALEEYKQVDNNQYSYLITAAVRGATGDVVAQLQALQIEYSRT